MTVKVYISGVCGSQEVRKRQQRVLFVLTSMKIDYETVDITEPGKDDDREFMKEQCKLHDKTNVLPPQLFNDSEYCGDYSDFEVANDDDRLHVFLKLKEEPVANEITMNGSKEEEEEKKDEKQDEDKGENEDVDIFSNKDDEATGDSGVGEENKEEEKTEEKEEEEKPKDDDVEPSKPDENEGEESEEEEED